VLSTSVISWHVLNRSMPPWPSRLHLGSPTANHPPPNAKGKPVKHSPDSNQQYERYLQDPPLLGVPILASPDPTVPSLPKQRSRHGRSHSNPFTSIFGTGKRSEKVVDAEMQDATIDSLDRLGVSSTGLTTKDHMAGTSGSPNQNVEKDLVTGKCITCDSAMRWPRQVDSYRCQICLMVNDLKLSNSPLGGALRAGNTSSAAEKCKSN